MWRTEKLRCHRLVMLAPFLLIIQVLSSCGGGTSVAVCASTGPNNDFCSGFGSSSGSSGGSSSRTTATVSTATIAPPAGIYALDRIVDRPYVAGVTLRLAWADLEPEPGIYRFETIGQTVAAALDLNQKVTLALKVDALPGWLSTHDSAALASLAVALGEYEVAGVALGRHEVVGLLSLSGDELLKRHALEIWQTVFSAVPLAIETRDRALYGTSSLPDDVFWLFTGFSSTAMTNVSEAPAPVLMRACGAWLEQEAWPDCPWSVPDSPDTALAYAVKEQGASYFEFHAADLDSVDLYSQFEYWASIIGR